MDCSPPASSVHEDSPGKNTGVVAMPSSRGLSQPRGWTQVSHIASGFFTIWVTREAQEYWSGWPIPSPADLPDSGIEPGSPALQAESLPGKPPCLAYMYASQAASAVLDRVTLCTVARQAALSMGFSRQKYWRGVHYPPLGDLPKPGKLLTSPALAGRFFTTRATWETCWAQPKAAQTHNAPTLNLTQLLCWPH